MGILYTLKPSELRTLVAQLGDIETRKTFLDDLARKLRSIRLDGGAADNEICVTARKLSAAGIWTAFLPDELSFALAEVDQAVKALFLEGLEPDYKFAVEGRASGATKLDS